MNLKLNAEAILVIHDGENRKLIRLDKNIYTIGRSLDNLVVLTDHHVSRYHAVLYRIQNDNETQIRFRITDGNLQGVRSSNGLLVNGFQCLQHDLQHEDIIRFSEHTYAKFVSLEQTDLIKTEFLSDVDHAATWIKHKPHPSQAKFVCHDSNVQPEFQLSSKLDTDQICVSPTIQLDALPDLLLQVDADGTISAVQASNDPELKRLFPNIKPSQHVSELFSSSITQQILHNLEQVLESEAANFFDCDVLVDNVSYILEIRITSTTKDSALIIIRNIANRKLFEQCFIHGALYDSLTGLPNRDLFIKRMTHAIQLANRQQHSFAVLFIDLDRFKVINDSLGHTVGDQLLKTVARRLEAFLHPGDTAARVGGDEFAILLENLRDMEEVVHCVTRLQQGLALPIKVDKHEIFTSASIGIALSKKEYGDSEAMLRDADIAMYHAKSLGRGQYQIFSDAMHTRALQLMQVSGDLRHAIERQEFQLHYQPIVSLSRGDIVGFEALIRWIHPQRGMVSPGEFIQFAEETGLILPIGEWALEEACRQLKQWKRQFPQAQNMTMNVNLSGKQFTHAPLVQTIAQILRDTELQPEYLKLEITESILMENSQQSQTLLSQLKELGLQLCIDDFGTGYSSLSYLHRFPIDTLKVDRSFISSMDTDEENSGVVITHTIAVLAHHLGINLVAEGIETARQLALVRAARCEYGQGYFFAKPLPAEQAANLIMNPPHW